MDSETDSTGPRKELPPYSDEIWLCGVCRKPFDEPKTFPCLHSACSVCLVKLRYENTSEKNNCRCPYCNDTFSYEDVLNSTSNYFLKNAVEYLYVFSEHGFNKMCTFCALSKLESQASHVCLTCKDLLCSECSKYHSRTRQTVNHKVVLLSDVNHQIIANRVREQQIIPCNDKSHRDNAQYFCDTCDSLVCKECIVLEHKCHKLSGIPERATLQRHEIGTQLKKYSFLCHDYNEILKDMKSGIQKTVKSKNELLCKIEKSKENFIREISHQAESAKENVCHLFSVHLSHLFSSDKKVTDKLIKLEHALRLSETLINCGNDVEVAAFGNQLLTRLEALDLKLDNLENSSQPIGAEIDLAETMPNLFRITNITPPRQRDDVQTRCDEASVHPNKVCGRFASGVRYQDALAVRQPLHHPLSFLPGSVIPPMYRPYPSPNIVHPPFHVGLQINHMTNQGFFHNARGTTPMHHESDQALQTFLRHWNQSYGEAMVRPITPFVNPHFNNQYNVGKEEVDLRQNIHGSNSKENEQGQRSSSMTSHCLTTRKTNASQRSSLKFPETLYSACPNDLKVVSETKLEETSGNAQTLHEIKQLKCDMVSAVSMVDNDNESFPTMQQSMENLIKKTENKQLLSPMSREEDDWSELKGVEIFEETISKSSNPTETLTSKEELDAQRFVPACNQCNAVSSSDTGLSNVDEIQEFQELNLHFITDCQLPKESHSPSISDLCWVTSKSFVVSDSRNEVAKVFSIDGKTIFKIECPRIKHVACIDGIIACSCDTKMYLYDKDNKRSRCVVNYSSNSAKKNSIAQGLELDSIIVINNKDALLKKYSPCGRFVDGLHLNKHLSPKRMTKLRSDKLCVIDEQGALLTINSSGNIKVLYFNPDNNWKPSSITADCNDEIYILNSKNSTVVKISETGILLQTKQLPVKAGKCLCINKEGKFLTSDSSGKVFQFTWSDC